MSLSRNATGREFQRDGPATEKLLSLIRVRILFVAHVKTTAHRSDRRSISVKSWQSSANLEHGSTKSASHLLHLRLLSQDSIALASTTRTGYRCLACYSALLSHARHSSLIVVIILSVFTKRSEFISLLFERQALREAWVKMCLCSSVFHAACYQSINQSFFITPKGSTWKKYNIQ